MKKIELLAPAGDLEKLKIAISYGADAVYFGGEDFSLRSEAGSLSVEEISEGVAYAHEHNCKTYLAINIFAHNEDIEKLPKFLDKILDIPIDAIIFSDPGIYQIIKEKLPDMELHLSTQANNTNYETAKFWHSLGVKRIVTAREMSLKELIELRENMPKDMEIESFIHGAMCISYSGRCLLSNFMISRDANRGMCAHPCRWNYALMEEKRPGEYYPVEEDERGTYVFNSKDLCMIDHMPELIEAGISSVKIEGRMKTIFYLATVVRTYRTAIDAYYEDPKNYKVNPLWFSELSKVSNRHFTTGFFFDTPSCDAQNYESSAYIRNYDFIGIVQEYNEKTKIAKIQQRNKFRIGDELEIFGPGNTDFAIYEVKEMYDSETGLPISVAPHAQQLVDLPISFPVKRDDMLRRRRRTNVSRL